MPSLPTLIKQGLLIELCSASLKTSSPEGVYVTVAPGDPSLWSGVLFARKGPYAPAILRFQIIFPPLYPNLPPLITFSSDVFHPLLTPLTTYTYTTSGSSSDTISAADQERLPPGGFSLRHGFPHWFGPDRSSANNAETKHMDNEPVTVYEILDYLRNAFTNENVLNDIPLEAAANPGAFYAWQSHDPSVSTASSLVDGRHSSGTRKPGEWNWEGVWEERVKRGIQISQSTSAIFGGNVAGDEVIRFSDLEFGEYAKILDRMASVMNERQVRA